MRTAAEIEQRNSLKPERRKKPGPPPGYKPKPSSLKNLAPYPKGVSGNPGGLPGVDVAARIARNIFQLNEEEAYRGMAKEILAGKPYAFDVLANRAYGKMKETIVHEGLDVLAEKLNKLRKQKNGDGGAKSESSSGGAASDSSAT